MQRLPLVLAALGSLLVALAACPGGGAHGPGMVGHAAGGTVADPPLPAAHPMRVGVAATDCTHRGAGRDFPVGTGREFVTLGDVPFESLRAGDTVRVHWRPEPYREKLMIGGAGTAEQPIRLCGVPGPEGQLPVIDGDRATTRRGIEFPYDGHQVRGLITVGHRHDEPWLFQPKHFVIEGLEIRNASEGLVFTDRHGQPSAYSHIAAGIYVQRADHITVRGCDVHDNQTGLFIGGGGGAEVTHHVRIVGNHIHNNGSPTRYYEHNVYNEAVDVLYEYNHFESPRAGKRGVLGANIKERSAGVVIRYNWIEDGAHLLDIVDAQEARATTRSLPEFHRTFVYGNVFVRGRKPTGSMIHYGGDSGLLENYRKGTLFFFNNTTVVLNRDDRDYVRTEVFDVSTNEEHIVSFNNVYWSEVTPSDTNPIVLFGSRDGRTAGLGSFDADWIATGWSPADVRPSVKVTAKVIGVDRATRGQEPGFRDAAAHDFRPAPSSPLRGAGRPPPAAIPAGHRVQRQLVPQRKSAPRGDAGKTLGAWQ